MTYRYITIEPVAAHIDQVLDEHSEYSRGVKSETAIANAAPDLLEAGEAAYKVLSGLNRNILGAEACEAFGALGRAISKAKERP